MASMKLIGVSFSKQGPPLHGIVYYENNHTKDSHHPGKNSNTLRSTFSMETDQQSLLREPEHENQIAIKDPFHVWDDRIGFLLRIIRQASKRFACGRSE